MAERATRDAWKTRPMPAERARVRYERRFTSEEHARVSRGLIPREMEDKWFAFVEDDWLWLHRSWTGLCIYGVRLAREGDAWVAAEAWVNRDAAEYRVTDEGYDEGMLWFLVERLLLGNDVPFPVAGSSGAMRHHAVGYARPNDEE